MFSFPPASKSSSGRFGSGRRNALISSSTFSNSFSSAADLADISLTLAKIALTSPPAFLTCGTLSESLFLSLFAFSTLTNNSLRLSLNLSSGAKSTTQPFLASLSEINLGFSMICFISSINNPLFFNIYTREEFQISSQIADKLFFGLFLNFLSYRSFFFAFNFVFMWDDGDGGNSLFFIF